VTLTLTVIIRGHTMPGRDCFTAEAHANIHVGVQRKQEVVEQKPGDADSVEWRLAVDVTDERDFKGPFVHGKKGDRFLYLSWGDVDASGSFHMFRRAKLMLSAIDGDTINAACKRGALVGSLAMTLPNGTPVCAALRPPKIAWSAAP
jgi:hypothetical protein